MSLSEKQKSKIWESLVTDAKLNGLDPDDHKSVRERLKREFTAICLTVEAMSQNMASKPESAYASKERDNEKLESMVDELRTHRAQIEVFEEREQVLADERKNNQTEILNAIKSEIRALSGRQIWRRALLSRIIGGATTAVGCLIVLCWLVNTEMKPLKSTVDELKAEQNETLAQISDNPQGMVDFADKSLDLARQSNMHTVMMTAIASMLATPDAQMTIRDGKLVVKLRSNHVIIDNKADHTYLTIHSPMPMILESSIQERLESANRSLNADRR